MRGLRGFFPHFLATGMILGAIVVIGLYLGVHGWVDRFSYAGRVYCRGQPNPRLG